MKITKGERLTFALNKNLKIKIKEVAEREEKSISAYISNLIIQDLKNKGESVIIKTQLV